MTTNKIIPYKGCGEFNLSMTLEEVRAYLKNNKIPFQQELHEHKNTIDLPWDIVKISNEMSMYFAKSIMFMIWFSSPDKWELENGIYTGMDFKKAKKLDKKLIFDDDDELYKSPKGYWVEDNLFTKKVERIAVFIKEVLNDNVLDENGFRSYKWANKITHAQFSKETLKILKRLRYSTFEKYIVDDNTNGESTYCKLGIETNKIRLDLINQLTKLEWDTPNIDIKKGETAVFSCEIREESQAFNPCLKGVETISKTVKEEIKDVQLVTDIIRFNGNEYILIYDTAIIIKTDNNEYVFSRKGYLDEEIYVATKQDINDVYSIEDVKKVWNDKGKITVDVNRIIVSVK